LGGLKVRNIAAHGNAVGDVIDEILRAEGALEKNRVVFVLFCPLQGNFPVHAPRALPWAKM